MLWDWNLGRQATRFWTETQKKNTKCRWRESGCVLSRRESCSSGSFGHLRPPSIGPDLTCWRSVRLNSLAVRSTLWAFWSFCCIPVFCGVIVLVGGPLIAECCCHEGVYSVCNCVSVGGLIQMASTCPTWPTTRKCSWRGLYTLKCTTGNAAHLVSTALSKHGN